MFPLLLMLLQQLRATQPTYFFLVTLLLLIAGGVAWLIAAVLGFASRPRSDRRPAGFLTRLSA